MPSWSSFLKIEREALLAFLFEDREDEVIETENLQFTWTGNIPYLSTGHHDFHDQNGYPINKRPWGQLHAIDMNTGDFKWSVPLGTYPELEAKGYGSTGTFNIGGPVVTAGGLIFIGATLDGAFEPSTKKLVKNYGIIKWMVPGMPRHRPLCMKDGNSLSLAAGVEVSTKPHRVIAITALPYQINSTDPH